MASKQSWTKSSVLSIAILIVVVFISMGYQAPRRSRPIARVDEEPQLTPASVTAPGADRRDKSNANSETEIIAADPGEEAEQALDAKPPASGVEALPETSARRDGKPTCYFYDRPPRTGSTTISRTIGPCLRAKGFVQPKAETRWVRHLLVSRMVALNGTRIGLLSKHMYMNLDDVAVMRETCGKLLYVSSCKPMRERVWSAAKYLQVSSGPSVRRDVLTPEMKEKALKRYMENVKWELSLEGYPYLNESGKPLWVPVEQRMVPDYVIRAKNMDEDLGNLLKALNCSLEYQSSNVHEAGYESMAFLEKKKLMLGDATYLRLSKLAERVNEYGLRKAADLLL